MYHGRISLRNKDIVLDIFEKKERENLAFFKSLYNVYIYIFVLLCRNTTRAVPACFINSCPLVCAEYLKKLPFLCSGISSIYPQNSLPYISLSLQGKICEKATLEKRRFTSFVNVTSHVSTMYGSIPR